MLTMVFFLLQLSSYEKKIHQLKQELKKMQDLNRVSEGEVR